jgi:hypothetical protein
MSFSLDDYPKIDFSKESMNRSGFGLISINLFIATLCVGSLSYAQAKRSKKAEFQTTKVGLLQQNYSGTTNKSFALGSPGFGFELSTDSGGTFLRYFLKGRISYTEGRQGFLDGATVFTTNYKYSAFAPELGLALYPVTRRASGFNMYLWGIGSLSYNYLDLATIPANSTIKSKDQGFGNGYGGGLGFEYIIGASRGGSRFLVYGEVGFRDERVNLVKSDRFEISGMTFCLGAGF